MLNDSICQENRIITPDYLFKNDLSVIPVKLNGASKTAMVGWRRFQKQTPSENDFNRWNSWNPDMWALITGIKSGVIVFDFDGQGGLEIMQRLNIKPHVRTPSGGYHLYVKHPGGLIATISKSKNHSGIDIRADGGYACFYGQIKGKPYEWLRPYEPEPFETLPDELKALIKEQSGVAATAVRNKPSTPETANTNRLPQKNDETPDINAQAVNSAGRADYNELIRRALELVPAKGSRNATGHWLAQQLRDNRYDKTEVNSIMRRYHEQVNEQYPLDGHGERNEYSWQEAVATIESVFKQKTREPYNTQSRNIPDIEEIERRKARIESLLPGLLENGQIDGLEFGMAMYALSIKGQRKIAYSIIKDYFKCSKQQVKRKMKVLFTRNILENYKDKYNDFIIIPGTLGI